MADELRQRLAQQRAALLAQRNNQAQASVAFNVNPSTPPVPSIFQPATATAINDDDDDSESGVARQHYNYASRGRATIATAVSQQSTGFWNGRPLSKPVTSQPPASTAAIPSTHAPAPSPMLSVSSPSQLQSDLTAIDHHPQVGQHALSIPTVVPVSPAQHDPPNSHVSVPPALPPADAAVKRTMDSLLSYAQNRGMPFVQMVAEKNQANPLFSFLHDEHNIDHAYWQHCLRSQGLIKDAVESPTPAPPSTSSVSQNSAALSFLNSLQSETLKPLSLSPLPPEVSTTPLAGAAPIGSTMHPSRAALLNGESAPPPTSTGGVGKRRRFTEGPVVSAGITSPNESPTSSSPTNPHRQKWVSADAINTHHTADSLSMMAAYTNHLRQQDGDTSQRTVEEETRYRHHLMHPSTARRNRTVLSNSNDGDPDAVNHPIDETNIGHRLLRRMGWREGEALGRRGGGLVVPITIGDGDATSTAGLGHSQLSTKTLRSTDEATADEHAQMYKDYRLKMQAVYKHRRR